MIVSNVSDELITEEAKKNWLEYWRHFSSCDNGFCSEANCLNPYHYGVLVKKHDVTDDAVYVIPLCKAHSENLQQPIEVSEKTEVVLAEHTL